MKPNIYTSTNYASFDTPRWRAYYGHEETDPMTGDWLFLLIQKKPNGLEKEVCRYTNTELLEVANGSGPTDMLLAGLSMYFMKH
jgi:hypothetical protein